MNESFDIFAGSKFIESLRNGGYHDTSYAVGELVDNSIDANARHVEIICVEKFDNDINRYKLQYVAVLDNGDGMNANQLRRSLLFGSGNRGEHFADIGKFGMGLPNSSLSQCKRVDIYSWQNSSKPLNCFLDIDVIQHGDKQIPEPTSKEIPNIFEKSTDKLNRNHGTLIVWSKLDRCSWTTSKATLKHSSRLIGRIYRKFLNDKRLEIIIKTIRVSGNDEIESNEGKPMLPNDPMYLMVPSNTPEPWDKKAMFQPNEPKETRHLIQYKGEKHEIIVRYSIEKDELRDPETIKGDFGSTPPGKHASKNIGISILRADREITFDSSLVTTDDSRDRWWGVEIEIPSSLDIPLQLTNNKQHVVVLTKIMGIMGKRIKDEYDKDEEEREKDERDPTINELFRMIREIKAEIRSMARRIRLTRENTRKLGKLSVIDKKIDASIEKERKDGESSQSDVTRDELESDERVQEITARLVIKDVDPEEAKIEAEEIVANNKQIIFKKDVLQGSNFFDVESMGGGVMQITINIDHPAYKNLVALTEPEELENLNPKEKLNLLKDGLKLLLASWARYEDLSLPEHRKRVQNIRFEWGKELDHFLSENKSEL